MTENVLTLVGNIPEIRNWNELKKILRLTFGQEKNLDCVVKDMVNLKPSKNESSFTFEQRIQKCLIASKLKS